jgi:hypothetical protein
MILTRMQCENEISRQILRFRFRALACTVVNRRIVMGKHAANKIWCLDACDSSSLLSGGECSMAKSNASVPIQEISHSIHVLRGQKVLLDEDLARLYGVLTGALIQAVKRNMARFPMDFMFKLSAAEWTALRTRHQGQHPDHARFRALSYNYADCLPRTMSWAGDSNS